MIATLASVPELLKSLPNWIWWRRENDTKVPYVVGNWSRHASSTDPSTWTTFANAVHNMTLSKTEGVGFVIHGAAQEKKIVGFDLDGCRNPETGELTSWAQELMEEIGSYTEITPSETGVRVWVIGDLPRGTRVFNLDPAAGFGDKVKIEVFDCARYFTVTGNACGGWVGQQDIQQRNLEPIYRFCEHIRNQFPAAKPIATVTDFSDHGCVQIKHTGTILTSKLGLLLYGNVAQAKPFIIEDGCGNSVEYPSHSEADMALATLLAMNGKSTEEIVEAFRASSLYRRKWERESYRENTITKAMETAKKLKAQEPKPAQQPRVLMEPEAKAILPEEDTNPESVIPPFDPSVVNGIYAEFVKLVTRGTTLNPQYAFAIAKTVVGIRMAGKVKFEDLDAEPRYYTALIGETGSGKGEAWRRTYQVLTVPGLVGDCGFKIVNDADSGAGLKDLFFPSPKTPMSEWTPKPVLCFVDEITTLGNKSKETRNPGILDEMITLANSTSVSRTLAARSGGNRSTDQARLAIVMCGQNGEVFMKAFAGRTKLGWYDRLYPEFGAPVEVGDLPAIEPVSAMELVLKLNSLDYSGTMKMSPEAKRLLDDCWNTQTPEIKKKARFRSNLKLDAYMSAFGRGLKVVEAEDADVAIKIFKRQIVIRQVCFTTEVPDRVGYYLGLIKRITERMIKQLAAGYPAEQVAKSRRDYETATNAYRDNEEHIFAKAWETHSKVHLQPVTITKTNGHEYQKFLPVPQE
jgi:putative DNA primase/helicase